MGDFNIGEESIFLRINELMSGNIQLTDATNAARLVKEHGRDIRYNKAWKKWIVWNGKYWQTDDSGSMIHEKNLSTVRKFYREILKSDDHKERIEIEKFGIISESVRRREATVKAAQWIDEINITIEDLDSDPFLLNVENGTVNVITREFTVHRRENMITKMANVKFDPDADCPKWKQFIREIMDYKVELINFLQTAAGWSLTGDISEQIMFILYGSGANGKSTFLNVLACLMGDYSTAANTETFMKKNGDSYTNDLARLRGTRFVSTTEAEQGRRISEPMIKQITGTDKLTARFLYGEFFNFVPTFKVFMATNHKPVIKGTDHGIWRRIRLIPFTTRIEEAKQDKELEAKLNQEASGILNWLLEGAERWARERLQSPDIITNATDEYRAEMDVMGNFLKNCCVAKDGSKIVIRELYRAYADWCDENNEHPVSERMFSVRLKEMGFEQARSANARFWVGLAFQE